MWGGICLTSSMLVHERGSIAAMSNICDDDPPSNGFFMLVVFIGVISSVIIIFKNITSEGRTDLRLFKSLANKELYS